MAKQRDDRTKDRVESKQNQDRFTQVEQPEYWDMCDPADEMFWNEFFRIEEILDFHDDLDPATFSVTIQNHKTGQVRSYPRIRLLSGRKRVLC